MLSQYLSDCLHAGAAFVLFLPLFVFPGYLLCRLTGIFAFRTQSFLTQLCLSLAFSVSIIPILLFFLWSISVQCVIAAYWLLTAAGVLLLLKTRPSLRQLRIPPAIFSVAAVWTVFVLFSLIDLPLGNGLYITGVAEPDHSYRVEIIAQLARSAKLPPTFPFLSGQLGKSILRYHYFWFMVCGAIPRLTAWRIGARDALNASVLWIGFLLLAMVGLYWKFIFHARQAVLKSLWTIPVLFLGGLQGPLYLLMLVYHRHRWGQWQLTRPTLTWIESLGQITNWPDSLLWVPNHVAAAIASLAALLALHSMYRSTARKQRAILAVVAGLSLASTVGLSVFVGMPFFAYVGVLCAYRLFKAPRNRLWIELAGTLGLAMLAIAPYLLEIRAPAGTPSPIAFSIRPSTLAKILGRHIHGITVPGQQALNFAALPAVFFYELGMLALIALWAFFRRKGARTQTERETDRLAALFASVTLAIMLFVSSREISGGSNDLGWRVPLGSLFLLAFYAVRFFESWRATGLPPILTPRLAWLKPVLLLLVLAGFTTTVAELLLLRFYYVATNTPQQATETADLRAATNFLRANTPPNAVVQLNPETDIAAQSGLFLERRTALRAGSNIFYRYNALDPDLVLNTQRDIQSLYSNSALSFQQIEQKCSALDIDYLILRPGDPAYDNRSSWVWQVEPFFQNPTVRIFRCQAVI